MKTAPVHMVQQAPVSVSPVAPGVVLVDYGRVAFGNLHLAPPSGATGRAVLHLGEALEGGRVLRTAPGSVRYARVEVAFDRGPVVVAPAADERNTSHPAAVRTPPEWGVVMPFRWVEIEGWPGTFDPAGLRRRAAFLASWEDAATSFASSDAVLDRIWDLCRYSIKATTFAGVYVDGDRERIAYEADAYLNQLSHYACDHDTRMARATFDRLVEFPTWPTEWAPHLVFMAHADWMHTGDRDWLAGRYDVLASKLLLERARADGLIASTPMQITKGDLVDWPAGERDGFVFTTVNSVVNAFHLRALARMADLADAVGHGGEAAAYRARVAATGRRFHERLFDARRGLFRDGEGTDHVSLHANLFPLAFGLVPAERRLSVASWLARRGMACSVYAAQYLLEGLFEQGLGREALELMTAPGDRSWRHMLDAGATITWEAWDHRYKPNQDWTHAWGAAPANLLPRYVLGVQPSAPGWAEARIRPHPAGLVHACGIVPTPRGPVRVRWDAGRVFRLDFALPPGLSARVELPVQPGGRGVFLDGRPVDAARRGVRWRLVQPLANTGCLEVR